MRNLKIDRAITAIAAGALLLLVSCLEPLSVPPCEATTLTPLSANADTTITSTGLRYIDGAIGRGVPADWCQTHAVSYTARLLDGTEFDRADSQDPLIFTPGLGGLIDGFEQGVIGMRIESNRRLIIPPELGFGSQERRDQNGNVVVPPNSTLIFDVEVQAVNIGTAQP